jgi:FkbM family methyltransferase
MWLGIDGGQRGVTHGGVNAELHEGLPEIPTIKIVDVGAMALEHGDEPYARLMASTPCEVVGFEPQAAECAKLNAQGRAGHTYSAHFIGDGREHTFYECNFSGMSSLLAPNLELLGLFQNLANVAQVVGTSKVSTTRLDDLPEAAGADFLKVDVQGGEGLVFAGAANVLQHAVVVHTEVEFVPMYQGQPLFAEIDQILRRQGFVFHRFAGLSSRAFQPLVRSNDLNAAFSQMLWGDAVYVKDFTGLAALSKVQLLKLAAIMHLNYESGDLAALALRHYDPRAADRYVEFLVGGGAKI